MNGWDGPSRQAPGYDPLFGLEPPDEAVDRIRGALEVIDRGAVLKAAQLGLDGPDGSRERR